MILRREDEMTPVQVDTPMTASFWKDGKFAKFKCIDCQVLVQPNYSEVTLRDEKGNYSMFVISKDPDIEAAMTQNDHCAAYDGFQLRDASGAIIEQIRAEDSSTIH